MLACSTERGSPNSCNAWHAGSRGMTASASLQASVHAVFFELQQHSMLGFRHSKTWLDVLLGFYCVVAYIAGPFCSRRARWRSVMFLDQQRKPRRRGRNEPMMKSRAGDWCSSAGRLDLPSPCVQTESCRSLSPYFGERQGIVLILLAHGSFRCRSKQKLAVRQVGLLHE